MSSSKAYRPGESTGGSNARALAHRQEMRLIDLIESKDTIRRYQANLDKMQKGSMDVTGFLKAASTEAAVQLTHLMFDGESDKVRLEATKEVLDRGGFGKTQRVSINGNVHVDHDTSKLELINLILSSARRAKIPVKGDLPPEEKKVGPTIEVESAAVSFSEKPPEGA